jgi:ribose transport system substrate-binding protein
MKPKLVVSVLSAEQDFQRAQVDDARAAAARCGFDMEVVVADNNAVVQIHQLFGYVHAPKSRQPVALVVEAATNEGLERVARAAVPAGIGWVLTSGHPPYLDSMQKEFPHALVSSATTNEDDLGKMMMQQYRLLLPNGGTILYIEGLSGSAGNVIRRRHAEEGVGSAKIKIGKMLAADWTTERAEQVMASWLRLKSSENFKPDLIAAQNDSIAIGARKAIMAFRPSWADIPMTGCDGLPDGGQRYVREGTLTATVEKRPTAGQAMEMVAAFLKKERLPAHIEVPPRSHPSLEDLARRTR